MAEKSESRGYFWQTAFVLVISLLASGCHTPGANANPTIEFTKVPPANEGGPDKVETISGLVTGAHSGQRIVLFAKSGIWWIQPLADKPFTEIQPDSTWNSSTHLGTEYAALLVRPGYRPPLTTEILPTQGGDVVAVAIAKGEGSPSTISKTLNFSGYEWKIRSTASERGGTTNAYDPANAWTDASGALHLRIARQASPHLDQRADQRAGKWTCAEVQLTRSLGYGSYLFTVRESSQLEPAAVLSLFTWDDLGADQNHRELDVEITRWGDPVSKNAQYVVQPFYVPANVARFAAPSGILTHSFRWEPGQVIFKTVRGDSGNGSRAVAEHLFTSGVPAPGGESVHLSLYVFGSTAVPLQNEAEVVIEKFEYLP